MIDPIGINYSYLIFQLISLIFIFGSPILTIITLFILRTRKLEQIPLALWALISLMPFLGAIAFWIVNPQPDPSSQV